jgi:ABC-type uncharacterized transport system fused permease/ATPase subunit
MQSPTHSPERINVDVNDGSLVGYLRFALSYWTGPTARMAWALTGAIAAIIGATLIVNLGLNYWNRWFFDALEKKDAALIWSALVWLPLLIVGDGTPDETGEVNQAGATVANRVTAA